MAVSSALCSMATFPHFMKDFQRLCTRKVIEKKSTIMLPFLSALVRQITTRRCICIVRLLRGAVVDTTLHEAHPHLPNSLHVSCLLCNQIAPPARASSVSFYIDPTLKNVSKRHTGLLVRRKFSNFWQLVHHLKRLKQEGTLHTFAA